MLRGPQIHLRTVRQEDLETFLTLSSEIANRGVYFPLDLRTESGLNAEYQKSGFWGENSGMLLIFDSYAARLVGYVVFFKTVHYYQGYEIGYQIFAPRDMGKGYATEATRMFCKYLFDAKPILRLTIQVEPGNLASKRIAEKCGFQLEGIARSVFESYGKVTDIEVWSLTHEDFYSAPPPKPVELPPAED